jgi:CBS domain-containing protein
MKVGEICTRDPRAIERDATLVEAARRMRDEHVGDLVVAVEHDGRRVPVGVLTDRDIVVKAVAAELDPAARVSVVMSEDLLVTATEDEDVAPVLKRMRSFGVRRVPVVDASGGLVGLLAIDDVVAALSDALGEVAALVSHQAERSLV